MRKIFTTVLAAFLSAIVFSQSVVERVFVLNEGYFDFFTGEIITPASVGSYDPETGAYTVLDEIENARFATDIKINGGFYYVAADKYLLKYDLYTDELVLTAEIEGIRKIAFWNDLVIVTRGEYLVTYDAYVQAYDLNTFALAFEIPATDIAFASEGILVIDNNAYIAVNNGFDFGNEVGLIAKIDLPAETLTELIDLGDNGKNPDNIMLNGNYIYTLNNKDYTGSSVTTYDITSGARTTIDLINVSAGCGTSAFFIEHIFYQESFSTIMSKYQPLSTDLVTTFDFGKSFYGLAFDDINDLMYAAETDFFSYGKVHVYDMTGAELTSFDVSVSPGNLAFDVRTISDIHNISDINITVYPNPATDLIHIAAEENIQAVTVADMTGRVIFSKTEMHGVEYTVNSSNWDKGNYLVTIMLDNGVSNRYISIQ